MPRSRAWNSEPVVVTVAPTGADVFRKNNPNIPYTTSEIAQSSIEAAAAGATVVHLHVREDDGTPSGRPELFKDVISRIREGSELITMVSTGGANDMTIEERTTGLEAQPDLSGRRVGIDELRRRDVHHAAAGCPRDHRARHPGRDRARGRGIRRRSRGDRGPLARGRRDPVADADQPRVRSAGRDRRLAGGAGRDAPATAAGDVLDGHLRRTPPPENARRSRCCMARRASGRGSRTRSTSAAACWLRPTPRWSARRSSWPTRSVARSRPRSRRGRCSGSRRPNELADRSDRRDAGA